VDVPSKTFFIQEDAEMSTVNLLPLNSDRLWSGSSALNVSKARPHQSFMMLRGDDGRMEAASWSQYGYYLGAKWQEGKGGYNIRRRQEEEAARSSTQIAANVPAKIHLSM